MESAKSMEIKTLFEKIAHELSERKRLNRITYEMVEKGHMGTLFYEGKEEAYDEVIKLLDALRNGQTENT